MVSYFHKDANTKIGSSRIKRQMGGGGVMVLGAVSSIGNLQLKLIESKYTGKIY